MIDRLFGCRQMPRAFATTGNRSSIFMFLRPTSRLSKLRRLQGANVMRFRNVLLLLAFLLVSLLTAPSAVFAQTETGRITGTVTDPSGSVVPGATITLTSTTTGAVRTTVSDSVGRYVIANVPAGTYTLKFELSGFAPQTSNVVVNVGAAVTLDSKLRLAGTAESVNVIAEVPLVNVSNAEVSTMVRQEQIRDLPLLTRDPYDLVTIAGNVQDQPREQKDNG